MVIYLNNGIQAAAAAFVMEASIKTVRLLVSTVRSGVKALSGCLPPHTQTSHNAVTYLCVCMSQPLR